MATATDEHKKAGQKTGSVVQVIGSTFDAEFEEGELPHIYNALKIDTEVKGVRIRLIGEVQQHLGGNRVRPTVCPGMQALTRRPVPFKSARKHWAASSICWAYRRPRPTVC